MLDVLRPRDPAGDVRRRRLPGLYQYDDPLSGRRYMGCLHKVFATEIDVALFEEAERTRTGYGAVKLAGAPLRRCAFQVERAFDWGELSDALREPPLLRLAGRRRRRDPGLRSARSARRVKDPLHHEAPRQDPRLRSRRRGHPRRTTC